MVHPVVDLIDLVIEKINRIMHLFVNSLDVLISIMIISMGMDRMLTSLLIHSLWMLYILLCRI